jgi:hypothetical protein
MRTGEIMSESNGNKWLIGSGLFFGIYCLNVAVGKIGYLSESKPLFSLGDVWEFLMLFAAVLCLVVTMLFREKMSENQ